MKGYTMIRKYTPSRREKPESWLHQYWRRLDKSLIFAAILCSGCSILLLFSIWQNGISDAVGASYYRTQLFSCLLGIVCVGALSLIDYHKIAKLWFIYAPIALVLTCLCFTALGQRREGADDQAWLKIGSFQFQPSEVLKLAFILTFATHLSKDEENMNKPLHMLLLIVHGMIPTGLIALQGDYGTAIVFAVIFLGMLFTARISWKYVLALLITIPAALFAAWNFILGDTHKQRILVLLHPGTDPENLEYQQDRGLEALSNGKIFGVGLFSGEDAYVSVPEIHNDFMFAQVGQALGFVGAIAVVLVLAFLCLKVLYDGYRAKDSLGLFLCAGVFAMLFIHCVMNIGMVLKVAPVIGVPLPFISAGGTATVSMYVALGLVVSIYSQSKRKNRHR
ncbi:FtsW/RodA/SpoVE family cell cycle protein [uncultured Ruminococcus sp.]|uniref:FtsW/RodA/SpoVE family cell cycle protein n=1 Tax=uncultured Ruminococcus sp. TaxID=165186 RepID=UPI002674415D|nr:FtsW/RodA/SpoVE family cell cycle protein [uncultured Ruminococcus sp.]